MKRVEPSKVKEQEIRKLLAGESAESNGKGVLSELVRLSTEKVIQELLEEEQAEELGRGRYERVDGDGHRNGYEDATLKTAEGVLKIKRPQIRGLPGGFRSKLWEGMNKTSDVLEDIVREMWVRGLSVRDVEEAMLAATGAFVLSDTTVSRVTEQLYEQYEVFRGRRLETFDVAYLFIDAVYEPLRRYGSKVGVLCAWAICMDGSRVLLGLVTGNSESESNCVSFLRDLVSRGLKTPLTITTDGAVGLTKAVEVLWPKSLRLRCWFHKMQNLADKVPPEAWPAFKALVADVRDAPDHEEGKRRLKVLIAEKQHEFPEACRCLADDMEASLNHLHAPYRHRQMIRTTNLVERSFVEERRRTKTIPHLWDEKGLVKLVFATLIRVSEKWSKRQFNHLEERELRHWKHTLFSQELSHEAPDASMRKRRSAQRVAA